MRIISGEFRSRRLETPADDSVTRPIPDRVKESLFGHLRGHCEGASVFDGFAGTGALGLEVISRGGANCVFIERDRNIAEILRRNIETLGAEDRCQVVVGDALGAGALARAPRPLTLAFLDPPYPLVEEPIGFRRVMAQMAALVALLSDDGFAMLRTPHPLRHQVAPAPLVEQPLDPKADPQPATSKSKRSRVKAGRHQRRRSALDPLDLPDEQSMEDEPDAQPAELVAPTPKPIYTPADLTLPNALGPETHTYHNMAIHLYQRRQP